ncbi:transcription antitermination factor NusB [Neoehrlichia mikurensis]|uniref:Transcription antitermination factor NusB n=1 Tax=Neoehrlichia mikurensis TaxID=89586 RepID=A0A9Q9F3A7_9RICK|nr:transcription antitermination factor NusB [Neoehrlichia mikurensis]QXK92067.1 transcription antitermination factor NusB [Neoehrlichia mikurensis]QXK92524.1 transcription antitermination factor NusB [Neoehrlichia mikurensis]QXK93760.1 transcription antitermination factor NusB [Neoehrlichia mikurensis]UTO55264.1 transcription antitermination factor NusB [Neoehrlichia mikurensis]UTO56185.1 transcription antitermination factor NusB [Neoehrlichia mikurensis]
MQNNKLSWHSQKTAARFLAVQGVYSMMFINYSPVDIDNLIDYLHEMQEVLNLVKADNKLLSKILETIIDYSSNIDDIISQHLNEKWSIQRLNLISLAVIKTAICELICYDTDAGIIINEYVNISSSILEDTEVSFVNAILNKIKIVHPVDILRVNNDILNNVTKSMTTVINSL